jgi:methyltransferase-like protein/SAM-dependent methyltransferase
MTTMTTPYDLVPYTSYPYPQSQPERLATLATVFGLRPPDVRRCRVLELGSSSGGNLLPTAERFPDSTFVGLDASARQVEIGREFLSRLDVPNLRLEHRDLMDVTPQDGQYDYILCHGVYSWVPPQAQDRILSICRDNLAPNGVAYVSYNTFPGWHFKGIARDVMYYRARDFTDPADRLRHARMVLDFLAEAVPPEKDNPYGILLRNEVESLRDKEDHYLLHEHLEEHNEAIYFHQFVDRARRHKLQYLAEADYSVMSVQNFPERIERTLQNLATDVVGVEQYMDFVRNRTFRQTLLVHEEAKVDRTPDPQRLMSLHVASPARPEKPAPTSSGKGEPARKDAPDATTVFRARGSVTRTSDPLMKAALLHLGDVWPVAVPFAELLAVARSRLDPDAVVVDAAHANQDARRLAQPLLRCYATGAVELSTTPSAFTLALSDRPLASSFARLQAVTSNRVTNRRHELVTLNDLQRHILPLLDGSNDRAEILARLIEVTAAGALVVHDKGLRLTDSGRIRHVLDRPLSAALDSLARSAILLS